MTNYDRNFGRIVFRCGRDFSGSRDHLKAPWFKKFLHEHFGAAIWNACSESLATHGRLLTCGVTTGGEVKLNVQSLFGRQRTIMGSFMGSKGELIEALKFIRDLKLKAAIDSMFPLQEAAATQRKMESRDFFGKILLHP